MRMNKQDRQGVRTPAALDRRYDLGAVKKQSNTAKEQSDKALKVASEMNETSGGLSLKVEALDKEINGEGGVKAQLDLKVETDADGNLQSRVHVSGNKFTVDTDNFKLNEDGTVTITGKITSAEVDITGGKFKLPMQYGNVVRMGADVDGLSIDNFDRSDVESMTRVSIFPFGIAYSSKDIGLSTIPISFHHSAEGEFYHSLHGTWYLEMAGSSTPVTSDENKKRDIESQPEIYSRIFDRLRPVIFRYKNGTSDRLHTGLIAQEVEAAALAEGVDTKDFAAICYEVDENGNKSNYGVRYEEIVSMCVKEIQRLKERIKALEKGVEK